jgi:hypothetical protein
MPKQTMSWKRVGSVMVVAHAKENPDPAEWSAFIAEVSSKDAQLSHLLVFTAGATISSVQRGQIVDVVKEHKLKIGVATDSAMVRGVVTALGWFGVPIKAMPPERLADLIEKVEIAQGERKEVRFVVEEMKARVT